MTSGKVGLPDGQPDGPRPGHWDAWALSPIFRG
jgi:hypothetical protein